MFDPITRLFISFNAARARRAIAAAPGRTGRALIRFLIALDSRAAALGSVILGGLLVAVGAALIFLPAGVILAGGELILFALYMVDMPESK